MGLVNIMTTILVMPIARMTTALIDMPIQLGPDLSEQEWQQLLQGHREAMTEQLRAMTATDPRYAAVERAARGLFWHTNVTVL
jgi:hypothetical protein